MLLIHLIKFWYPEALQIFVRVWINSMSLLEEDLAVGLMWRLLGVPLYHDSTIFGRVMSFGFRLSRVTIGIFAMGCLTLLTASLALIWFVTPVTLLILLWGFFLPDFEYFEWLKMLIPIFVFGLGLFVNHIVQRPLVKVWKVQFAGDIWKCTKMKPSQTGFTDLLQTAEVKKLLNLLEIDLDSIGIESVDFKPDEATIEQQKLWNTVILLAKKNQAPFITPGYFFISHLRNVPDLEEKLMQVNLVYGDFEQALRLIEEERKLWRKVFIWDDDFAVKHLRGTNRGWLGGPTPHLDAISEDLTKKASLGSVEDFIGREEIKVEVSRILSQSNDRNVMLIGEPGSGRSTLVNYLAKQIVIGDAPDVLATKRLVRIDLSKLLSGVEHEGEVALKIKDAFEEIESIENIILFFDEFHTVGIGEAANSLSILPLIMPYLESSKIQFIASTDNANYAKILQKNGSIARLFHKVEVRPASHDETMQILIGRSIEVARYQKVTFTYLALKEILEKSERFIHDRVLPDCAMYLFTEAVSLGLKVVKSADISKLVSARIHVPMLDNDSAKKKELLNMESIIHQKMIDQEGAVKVISDTLRRSAAQIREQGRPIGSFLFVGPTGVGKTELSKILAEIYFKSNDAFVRFDMSEYQSSESVNRLIGDNDNPGELTESVRNKPFCLILLDEFEKADPKLLTLFLQVLDDGRLTGGDGKTVDFTNTIIIATSNVGSLLIADSLKKSSALDGVKPLTDWEKLEEKVQEELLKQFKPELVNRFDNVVIFKPLSEEDLEKIVLIKLEDLKNLMRDQGYEIEFDQQMTKYLVTKGFDNVLGARPLRRLIQDTIEAKLSKMILSDEIRKGVQFKFAPDLLDPELKES